VDHAAHLDILGRLGRLLRSGPARELLLSDAADETIFKVVADSDATVTGSAHPESGP
jgi:hypothetical protein